MKNQTTYSKNATRQFCVALRAYLMAGVGVAALMMPHVAHAATESKKPPVDFVADHLEYDDANQIITATGMVEISQDGRVLKADKVIYNLTSEKAFAVGNVAIMDKNGDVHFSEQTELTRDMREGYIRKLRSVLADGSRITAQEVTRQNGAPVQMRDASYTPCEPCKVDPSKSPLWQIRSDKVVYDPDKKEMIYRDATFDVAGVPVAYTPYFSHSVDNVRQESGFLAPKFALNSRLGFSVTPSYYWAIDPYQDATFGVRAFSKQAPMGLLEYRRRFENAEVNIKSSATYSDRTDSVAGEDVALNDEWRGHFEGKALWNIDDHWRAGIKSKISSDDQYLRQYDLSKEDVLRNEIYAERFEDRNYFSARALAFQDVRVSDRASDQPNIIPETISSFVGAPSGLLGGRWNVDVSTLGLARKGNGQDVLRVSGDAGWQRRDVVPLGVVNTITTSLRTDAYNVPKRDDLGVNDEDSSSMSFRFFPSIHNVTSMPFVSDITDERRAIVEPTVALTVAPRVKNNKNIPNEDSQDVQIDAANFFRADRFPGLDRVEDRTHVTYGVRSGLYDDNASMAEVFLGQSYRFDEASNPFPKGSGLSDQSSNYVGQVVMQYLDLFNMDYRFQLSDSTFSSQQHELATTATLGPVKLLGNYLYARELEGTDFTQSREQISGGLDYEFVEDWHARVAGRYDLSQENRGLRDADFGIDYLGQCLTFSTTARRSYSDNSSGDRGTEVLLTIGFKNLGSVGTGE